MLLWDNESIIKIEPGRCFVDDFFKTGIMKALLK